MSLTFKFHNGQVVEEAVVVVDHGEVVEGALLLRLLVEVLLLEDAVVGVEVVDDLDEPVTVRQFLNNYVSQGDERLDLLGGEPAVLNFQVDGGAEDLSQLLPRRRCGNLDCSALVAPGDPDLAGAHAEHEVEGADGLLVAGEDVAVADHGLVHRLLVVDEAGDLLSGHHLLFAVSFL